MIENNQSRYALSVNFLSICAHMFFRESELHIKTGAKRPPFAALLPRPGLASTRAHMTEKTTARAKEPARRRRYESGGGDTLCNREENHFEHRRTIDASTGWANDGRIKAGSSNNGRNANGEIEVRMVGDQGLEPWASPV